MSTVPADAGSRAPAGDELAAATSVEARSASQLFWLRLRRDRVTLAGLAFVAVLIVVAVTAPVITSLAGVPGPNVQQRESLSSFGTPSGPSGEHPFGVDPLGRDVLARVVYGARVSLQVALIATGIAVALGLLAGFFRGWVDTLISRTMDALQSDHPLRPAGDPGHRALRRVLHRGADAAGGHRVRVPRPAGAIRMSELVLRVEDLRVHFETEDGLVKAVDGVSFAVERSRMLGLVGESGSGKSVSAMTVLGLTRSRNARISGRVLLSGPTSSRSPSASCARCGGRTWR